MCWAVHKLTAFYGLDHARSLAVVLGARYKYSINSKREKLEKLGKELFELSNLDGDFEQICVEKIVEFFESLGVLTHLKAYNTTQKTLRIRFRRFLKSAALLLAKMAK